MNVSLLREWVQCLLTERKVQNFGLQNTVFSDMNEILMASALMGGTSLRDVASTVGADAARQVNQRAKMIRDAVRNAGLPVSAANERIEVELANGDVMADAVIDWTTSNGYGTPTDVYWTARPGALQQALDAAGQDEIATPGHPADIAVVFDDGQVLGISAKATKGSGDIAFKNLGWGTIAKETGLDPALLDSLIERELSKIDPALISIPAKARKAELRKDPGTKARADEGGRRVLKALRDEIISAFSRMGKQSLDNFVLEKLMDAGSITIPRYIKVTATKGGENAHVSDPGQNPTLSMVQSGVKPVPRGNDSIVFVTRKGNQNAVQLRLKWESQALASSMKSSGEPAAKGK